MIISNQISCLFNFFIRFGIHVAGISSDADSRLLASMKHHMHEILRCDPVDFLRNSTDPLIIRGIDIDLVSFLQDIIHILTKGRNKMLMPSVNLPMGIDQVSVSHLKVLISTVSKEVHGLVRSDISPDDRQNFRSLEKCFNDRVLNSLKAHVPGSKCTIMYLKLFREIYSAFTDTSMKPLERVRLMWQATYFIRAWRSWILDNKNTYKLNENFLPMPTYSCIEINAYGLLHIIEKFKRNGTPELFLPVLFNSQTCESTFRQLRSMTSIFWTKINFSLLELINMVGRLELINDIVYDKLASEVCFLRVQNRIEKCIIHDLPTNEEIVKVLEKAKESALLDAANLGMVVDPNKLNLSGFANESQPNYEAQLMRTIANCDNEDDSPEGPIVCNEIDGIFAVEQTAEETVRANLEQEYQPDVRYIEIKEKDGSIKTVLKSSVIWSLTDSKDTVSKDRTKRFYGSTPNKSSRKRKTINENVNNEPSSKRKKNIENVYRAKELIIGDWALFERNITSNEVESCSSAYLFGMIVGFKYIQGKCNKSKQYSLDSVPISAENTSNRGVEALATWKSVDPEFITHSLPGNSYFININQYIATIRPENPFVFKLDCFSDEIMKILSERIKLFFQYKYFFIW